MPNTREKLIGLLIDSEFRWAGAGGRFGLTADNLIANGVTIQKWIPVSERLPEANEKVLICSIIGNQYVAYHLRGHFYVDGSTVATSHWMPLPRTEGLE